VSDERWLLQATEELQETTHRLENELKNLAVSLQSGECQRRELSTSACSLTALAEQRLAEKIDQFSGQVSLQRELLALP
jgi:hypothetical protein